ncbi:MAG: hypothetical protein LBE27_04445 [Deltaproteobacteria bacterium]|jgi:flagellar biosynthesis/type III secretory pathway protein FliH|nr:hypothetical protein [Deltaproteobacteria bacterium]
MERDPLTGKLWKDVDEPKIKAAFQKGLQEGIQKGLQQGSQKINRSLAIGCLKQGVPRETILRALKVSEEWLLDLEKELDIKKP